ncbi:hypothetical protein CF137_14540 [Aeromonas sobria]|jgi:hypothetical protein|nr:hypothetical protein CF137_14540 [Aeromonas sobria]
MYLSLIVLTGENLNSQIEFLLDSVHSKIVEHEKASVQNGVNFNLFSILNIERDEVGTHSRFIYELLNPKGAHNLGYYPVKTLLGIINLDVDDHNIEVRREDLTTSGRRIDFTISTKSHLIGIEMKIDAGDQYNQLDDYYDELFLRAKANEKVSIFYLTLNGRNPSIYSLGKLPIECVNCISFDIHILTWLQKCVERAPKESVVKQTLNQYLSLVEKLTHKSGLTPSLSNELAGSTEKMLAALSISEAVVYAKESIMRLFWNELNAKLISVGKKPEIYGGSNIDDICHAYFFKSKNNRNIGIRYCIYQDSFKSIWTYINLYSWLHYGLRSHDKNNRLCVDPELKSSINNDFGVGNAFSAKEPDWLSCYYFDPDQECPHPIAFEKYENNESCTYVYFTQIKNRTLRIEQLIQHIYKMESNIKYLFT